MKCQMEENSRRYEVLSALETGYTTGDFGELFPYLAQDCVLESQWVLTPLTGYDAVTEYYTGKGETLAKSDSFPSCCFVELLGKCNPVKNARISENGAEPRAASIGLLYTPGKLCLLMEQQLDDRKNRVIIDVTLNDSGTVRRIDMCMPELFRYREVYEFVDVAPFSEELPEEKDEFGCLAHLASVFEPYFNELNLFFGCADERFSEYDNLHIPMNKWCEMLEYWKLFTSAKDYDSAFEALTGADYEAGTVQNKWAAEYLGSFGKRIWDNRQNSKVILDGLIEWTNIYKNSYTYINTYGW